MSILQSVLLSSIAAYRKVVSPFLPASCRFYPSCSQYAAEAIGKHGVGRGVVMAVKRVGRCHPWHPGGLDPVADPGGCGEPSNGEVAEDISHGTIKT